MIRLAFDAERCALIATRYGDPHVYAITLDGKFKVKLDAGLSEPHLEAAPDGRGDLWIDRPARTGDWIGRRG